MTIYIDDTAAGTNDGTSWTNAYTSFQSSVGTTSPAANEEIRIAYTHNETLSASVHNWCINGTKSQPLKLISTDPADDSYRTGARLSGSSNYSIIGNGSCRVYGCVFDMSSALWRFSIGCDFQLVQLFDCTVTSNGQVEFNNCDNTVYEYYDCVWEFANFEPFGDGSAISWFGGSITQTSGSSDTYIFGEGTNWNASRILLEGVTISGTAWTKVHGFADNNMALIQVVNCTIPASIITSDQTDNTMEISVSGSQNGTLTNRANAFYAHKSYYGDATRDETRYRDNGVQDHSRFSVSLTTEFGSLEVYNAAKSCWIHVPVRGGRSYGLEFYLASGGALQNDEVWVELFSPSEGSTAASLHQNTRAAPLATPTNLTTDSVNSWTGTGVGTKQQINITINPSFDGFLKFRWAFAKASSTAYFDLLPGGLDLADYRLFGLGSELVLMPRLLYQPSLRSL